MLFAILVFALLGIAALCVDLGFASLAQSQMQTAADTAALEGVRLRDYSEYHNLTNQYRRGRVSELVRQVCDDDLHPTQGLAGTTEEPWSPSGPPIPGALAADDEDALRLGAGPIYRLEGGLDASHSSAVLAAPTGSDRTAAERWIDDPQLQANTPNRPNGDMLTGAYNASAPHSEADDYTRADFTPASSTPVGPSIPSWDALGFLVRMRRTAGSNVLDDAPGVSSRGATLPLLFGMGAPIQSGSGAYDPRRDGLTTRAVAIAVGRPPLTIGPPTLRENGAPMPDRLGRPIRGVGYWYYPQGTANPTSRRHVVVALSESFWAALPFHGSVPESPETLTVRPDGAIEFRTSATSVAQVVGQLLVAPCDAATQNETCPGSVGITLGISVEQNLAQAPFLYTQSDVDAIIARAGFVNDTNRCYLPVYGAITAPNGTTTNRIIAFGYGRLTYNAGQLGIFKGWSDGADTSVSPVIVAPDNATSRLSDRAPTLSASEWAQVFDQNQLFVYPSGNSSYALSNVRAGTVLTPVLAR